MFTSQHDIISEIDDTIEQLIKNGKVLKNIETKKCYEQETEALNKAQESLLAHLIHMDDLLKSKKSQTPAEKDPLLSSKVHKKLGRSGYLNTLIEKKEAIKKTKQANKRPQKGPKIHKRKVFVNKKP